MTAKQEGSGLRAANAIWEIAVAWTVDAATACLGWEEEEEEEEKRDVCLVCICTVMFNMKYMVSLIFFFFERGGKENGDGLLTVLHLAAFSCFRIMDDPSPPMRPPTAAPAIATAAILFD